MKAFLERIGKNCGDYHDKFASWGELFTFTGAQMKEKGIPISARRWIMQWREKYRHGEEPFSIKFKSKSKKNKDQKKKIFIKHLEPLYKQLVVIPAIFRHLSPY